MGIRCVSADQLSQLLGIVLGRIRFRRPKEFFYRTEFLFGPSAHWSRRNLGNIVKKLLNPSSEGDFRHVVSRPTCPKFSKYHLLSFLIPTRNVHVSGRPNWCAHVSLSFFFGGNSACGLVFIRRRKGRRWVYVQHKMQIAAGSPF